MNDTSNDIWEAGDIGEDISGKSRISVTYTPAQHGFYQELETAVRKHYQYLHEVTEMASVKLPKWYPMVKRGMDIIVGVMGLILLSLAITK